MPCSRPHNQAAAMQPLFPHRPQHALVPSVVARLQTLHMAPSVNAAALPHRLRRLSASPVPWAHRRHRRARQCRAAPHQARDDTSATIMPHRCSACGAVGHRASKCPTRGITTELHQCSRCSRTGHNARLCLAPQRGGTVANTAHGTVREHGSASAATVTPRRGDPASPSRGRRQGSAITLPARAQRASVVAQLHMAPSVSVAALLHRLRHSNVRVPTWPLVNGHVRHRVFTAWNSMRRGCQSKRSAK